MAPRKNPAKRGEHKEAPQPADARRVIVVDHACLTSMAVSGSRGQLLSLLSVLLPSIDRLGLDPSRADTLKPGKKAAGFPNILDVKRWADSLVDSDCLKGKVAKKEAEVEVCFLADLVATIAGRLSEEDFNLAIKGAKALH